MLQEIRARRSHSALPTMTSDPPLRPSIKVLLLATAFSLPLLVNLWGWDRVETPRMTLLRLVTLVGCLLWVTQPGFRLPRLQVNGLLLSFTAVSLLSSLLSVDTGRSATELMSLLTYLAYFALVYTAALDARFVRQLTLAIMASALLMALYGVGQHWGIDPLHWKTPPHVLRKTFSTFGNRIFLAGYFAMLVPLGLALAVSARRRSSRVLHLAVLLLVTACLLLSYGRAGWGAAAVAVGLFWVSCARARIPFALRSCGVALALLALLWVGIEWMDRRGGESMVARVTSTSTREPSVRYHRFFWEATSYMVFSASSSTAVAGESRTLARLLLGWGPGTYDLVLPWFTDVNELGLMSPTSGVPPQNPHCDLLLVVAATGLVGLVLWVRLMVRMGLVANRLVTRVDRDSALLISGWGACGAAYVFQSVFTPRVVGTQLLLWTCMGVLCAAATRALPGFAAQPAPEQPSRGSLPAWARRAAATTLVLLLLLPGALPRAWTVDGVTLRTYPVPALLAPLLAEYHLKRAVTHRDAGRFDEAFREHQVALNYEPRRRLHWYALAETAVTAAKAEQKHWKSWMVVAQRAYRYLTGTAPLEALARWEMGEALLVGEALSRADGERRGAPHGAAMDPEGRTQLRRNEWALGAEKEFRAAIALSPRISAAHHGLAKSLQAQGRIEQAVRAYLRAIRLGSTWGEPEANLGWLYWRLNLTGPALYCLEQAQQRSPADNPYLPRYREILALMRERAARNIVEPRGPIQEPGPF